MVETNQIKFEEDEFMIRSPFDGGVVSVLNEGLAYKQRLTHEDLAILRSLHQLKLAYHNKIESTSNITELRTIVKALTELEFQLQSAWKFPQNVNYHKFWNTPTCTCPVMDNEDRYPYGRYFVSQSCVLHGWIDVEPNNPKREHNDNER